MSGRTHCRGGGKGDGDFGVDGSRTFVVEGEFEQSRGHVAGSGVPHDEGAEGPDSQGQWAAGQFGNEVGHGVMTPVVDGGGGKGHSDLAHADGEPLCVTAARGHDVVVDRDQANLAGALKREVAGA